VDEQGAFVSGTGVVGQCDAGVGVHDGGVFVIILWNGLPLGS